MGIGFIISFIVMCICLPYYLVRLGAEMLGALGNQGGYAMTEAKRNELKEKLYTTESEEKAVFELINKWKADGFRRGNEYDVVYEELKEDFEYIFGKDYKIRHQELLKEDRYARNDEVILAELVLAHKGKSLNRFSYSLYYDYYPSDEFNSRICSRIELLWWAAGIHERLEISNFKNLYFKRDGYGRVAKQFGIPIKLGFAGWKSYIRLIPSSLNFMNENWHKQAKIFMNELDGIDGFAYRDLDAYIVGKDEAWIYLKD